MSKRTIGLTLDEEQASFLCSVLDCVAGPVAGPRRHADLMLECLEQAGVTYDRADTPIGAIVVGAEPDEAWDLLDTEIALDAARVYDEEEAA